MIIEKRIVITTPINRAAFKRHMLARAKELRPSHPFTRVSEETIDQFERQIRLAIDSFIRSHPAKGTTLKP
jgi:hypothetical protein